MSLKPKKKKDFRKRHPPPGALGTLMIDVASKPPVIRAFEYTDKEVKEHPVHDAERLRSLLSNDAKFWIDVQGVGDEQLLQRLADMFHIHPLALEDVVNVPSKPKADLHEHHLQIITRMVMPSSDGRVVTEQVAIFVGANYVLTFQEGLPGDVFDPVRARLKNSGGAMRAYGSDYLAYAIWDAIIDGYFPVLETFGEYIEELEARTVRAPTPALLIEIHDVKRQLLEMRRALWPQREAVNNLLREPTKFLSESVRLNMRDCYDHCVQLLDVLETYRELASGLMDIYLSSVSNRQNEIMKVLTIMASIFIPLTFIVGIYGMNFDYMPELRVWWAYPTLLGFMLLVALGMLYYFWRKGWFWPPGADLEDDKLTS